MHDFAEIPLPKFHALKCALLYGPLKKKMGLVLSPRLTGTCMLA